MNDPECKWILLERDGRALLVLCSWNPENTDLAIKIDSTMLGFTPDTVSDAETNPPGRVYVTQGKDIEARLADAVQENKEGHAETILTIPMPGYGVRMVYLEQAE